MKHNFPKALQFSPLPLKGTWSLAFCQVATLKFAEATVGRAEVFCWLGVACWSSVFKVEGGGEGRAWWI